LASAAIGTNAVYGFGRGDNLASSLIWSGVAIARLCRMHARLASDDASAQQSGLAGGCHVRRSRFAVSGV
jgi:hypothetical protein